MKFVSSKEGAMTEFGTPRAWESSQIERPTNKSLCGSKVRNQGRLRTECIMDSPDQNMWPLFRDKVSHVEETHHAI